SHAGVPSPEAPIDQRRPSMRICATFAVRCLAVLLVGFPAQAYANAGMPMLFLSWFGMLLALVPIIGVETGILVPLLSMPTRRGLYVAALANGVSTVVGIPVTWFLLVLVQLLTGGGRLYGLQTPFRKVLAVTWQAPWLLPYPADLYWMIPAA